MDDDFLKYGDQIMLFSDTAHGYLSTIGFSTPELFVEKCSKLHPSNVVNLRNMVFQVIPKLGYDPMRELKREQKATKARELNEQLKQGDNKQEEQRELSPAEILLVQEKTRMLQKRIEQQHVNNDRWIKLLAGKKIMYGKQIQLMHVDSGMFLQYSKKTSDYDRTCVNLELSSEPSAQRVTFFIQQRYKYRQDGEAVVYNDHILLYNQKYNCYLHVSEDFAQEQVKLDNACSKYRPKSPIRRAHPTEIFKSLEANCSPNFYKWQLINYRQAKPSDNLKYIYSGDVIRLKHAETNGYLCFDDISMKKTKNTCYVRIYKGVDANDRTTTNNLFEIEAHSDSRTTTTENAGRLLVWQQKGQVQTCLVRLRHLNSGRLLRVKLVSRKVGSKMKRQLILTLGKNLTGKEVNDRLDEIERVEQENRYNSNFNSMTDPRIARLSGAVGPEHVFEIEHSIVDVQNKVKNMSVAKISNAHYGMTISTEITRLDGDDGNDDGEDEGGPADDASASVQVSDNSKQDHLSQVEEEDEFVGAEHEIDENKFTPMMYEEIEFLKINNTNLVKNGTMDDVFIFEKVSEGDIRSLLFVHSCVPKIKEFTHNLRFNQSELTSPYLKEFENLLIQLVFFTIDTESENAFTCEGLPKKLHQKFLREIKIIDLLIDVLIYPFEGENAFLKLDDLNQKSPMTKVCQLIYRLIKHYVKDNEFNKFYAAQWISHFFHQNMMTTDSNNLLAETTTNEILNNNRPLLDRQINPQVIKNIIENCSKTKKNKRFLNLLSSLCQCSDDAISSNQDAICDLLLEEEAYADILIEIRTRRNGLTRTHEAIFNAKDTEQPLSLPVE